MKIVLATGIYPPDIGGPATYVHSLARVLTKNSHHVTVITYDTIFRDFPKDDSWAVVRVAKGGGPLMRWRRYAQELRAHGADSDAVIVFSSVSCGVPLRMSGLVGGKQKLMLRLGGDFFWERYTALGGTGGLADWYAGKHVSLLRWINSIVMPWLLRTFDHIVYSTQYQCAIHEAHYRGLPAHSVIQNALPEGKLHTHTLHHPIRLLYLGRFVGFKNIQSLLDAMHDLSDATLTLTGEGPMRSQLIELANDSALAGRVTFSKPVMSDEKSKVFDAHDMLILPSITEISPNVALEARAAGLPVLLTEATGLSDELTTGMIKAKLQTPMDISAAIREAIGRYDAIALAAGGQPPSRSWTAVAEEWERLLKTL